MSFCQLLRATLLAAAVSACGKAPTSLPLVDAAPGLPPASAPQLHVDQGDRRERVQEVGQRLIAAAAPLCQGDGDMCRPPIMLANGNGLNAYANGDGVTVSRPLVDLAHTQDQLALVLAHEMAHLLLGHTRRGSGGTAAISLDRGSARDDERAADRLGLYLLAHAGYQPREAIKLWQTLGAARPTLMADGKMHPGIAERHRAMLQICLEIEAKQRAGRPLIPGA